MKTVEKMAQKYANHHCPNWQHSPEAKMINKYWKASFIEGWRACREAIIKHAGPMNAFELIDLANFGEEESEDE